MAAPYRTLSDPQRARHEELRQELAMIEARIATAPYLEVRKHEIDQTLGELAKPKARRWVWAVRGLVGLLVVLALAFFVVRRLDAKVRQSSSGPDPNAEGWGQLHGRS